MRLVVYNNEHTKAAMGGFPLKLTGGKPILMCGFCRCELHEVGDGETLDDLVGFAADHFPSCPGHPDGPGFLWWVEPAATP